jgi:hypothetical protein
VATVRVQTKNGSNVVALIAIAAAGVILGLGFNPYALLAAVLVVLPLAAIASSPFGLIQAVATAGLSSVALQTGYCVGAVLAELTPLALPRGNRGDQPML